MLKQSSPPATIALWDNGNETTERQKHQKKKNFTMIFRQWIKWMQIMVKVHVLNLFMIWSDCLFRVGKIENKFKL